MTKGTAVVTGASSGIGAATAQCLHDAGFDVVVGARRLDRLHEVADPIGATAIELDVTDQTSIDTFCAQVDSCNVLINNAGGALGLETIAEADDDKWQRMYELNVLSVMRMTRALLPKLVAGGDGRIVNVGSTAAHHPYAGGGGYNAAKFAERAVTGVLRRELIGQPVRVIEIDPGMVETEFSLVRFDGDEEKAASVYEGVTPLTAQDVAECISFAVTRPAHVNIDQMLVTPRDQVMAFGHQIAPT